MVQVEVNFIGVEYMDSDGYLQVIILFLLLIGASYCASAEITFASINEIKLRKYAESGNKKAKNALDIVNNFDSALTTLLIGNNITHIGFASLVTALTTKHFGISYVKYSTILSTIVVFLFSEMIPKSFGKSNMNYALSISGSLKVFMVLFKPLNMVFMAVSDFFSRLFPSDDEPLINEEEFYEIVKSVGEEGKLSLEKQELVLSAMDFNVKTVKNIYQRIENVVAIDINWPFDKIKEVIIDSGYSRYPVYDKTTDKITGIVQKKEFYRNLIKSDNIKLKDIEHDPYFVRENDKIDVVLKKMNEAKNHLAIVLDGDKKVKGIVSVEDILEELVGEIWDEEDEISPMEISGGDVL